MVADNDISPLTPIWPTRSVVDKPGTQNQRNRQKQPEPKEEEKDSDATDAHENDKDNGNEDTGHIDEYA